MLFWKKKSEVLLDQHIIPLDEAKHLTKHWRKKYHEKFGGEAHLIKAVFIPMSDVRCLLRRYKKYHPSGVRAYLAFTTKHDPDGRENDFKSHVKIILVPATHCKDFYDKGPGSPGGPVGDTGNSSVYDFTSPCPDVCADANPLNGGSDLNEE